LRIKCAKGSLFITLKHIREEYCFFKQTTNKQITIKVLPYTIMNYLR